MEYCEELYAEQTEHELTKRELEELQKIAPPCTDTELNILIEETEHAIKKGTKDRGMTISQPR